MLLNLFADTMTTVKGQAVVYLQRKKHVYYAIHLLAQLSQLTKGFHITMLDFSVQRGFISLSI